MRFLSFSFSILLCSLISSQTRAQTTKQTAEPTFEKTLRATTRVLIPIGALGVGNVTDLRLGLRYKHLSLTADLTPSGGALVKGTDLGTYGALGFVGYEHRNFSAALGAGVSDARWIDGPQTTFTLAQRVRLGNYDDVGGTIEVYESIAGDKWKFAGFQGELVIAIKGPYALLARGGMGPSGVAFGEAGLKIRLFEEGFQRVDILGTLGGAGVFGPERFLDGQTERLSYAGPSAGVGIIWRN